LVIDYSRTKVNAYIGHVVRHLICVAFDVQGNKSLNLHGYTLEVLQAVLEAPIGGEFVDAGFALKLSEGVDEDERVPFDNDPLVMHGYRNVQALE